MGVDVDLVDESGRAAIHFAVASGRVATGCEQLCEQLWVYRQFGECTNCT